MKKILFLAVLFSFILAYSTLQAEEAKDTPLQFQEETEKNQKALEQISTTQSDAQAQQEDASLKIKEAQTIAEAKVSEEEKKLAQFKITLEKLREELAQTQLNFAESNKTQIEYYTQVTSELEKLTSQLQSNTHLVQGFQEVGTIWRTLADTTLKNFSIYLKTNWAPPSSPYLPSELEDKLKGSPHWEDYLKTYQATLTLIDDIQKNIIKFEKEKRKTLSSLLLKSGRLRSKYYIEIYTQGLENQIAFDDNYLGDLLREIKIVPYKPVAFFFDKISEITSKITLGVRGWISIIQQLLALSFLFILPYVFFIGISRASKFLDNFRNSLIQNPRKTTKFKKKLALWIYRANPYIPWLLTLSLVYTSKEFLQQSGVSEFGLILPYINIYLWYRVFILFLTTFLSKILITSTLNRLHSKQVQIHKTAKRFGILFFSELAFFHATEDTVRRVYVYSLISSLIIYINALFALWQLSKWSTEIEEFSKKMLPPSAYSTLEGFRKWPFSRYLLPALFFITSVLFLIYIEFRDWIVELDIFKKIHAELFKRKLQVALKEKEQNNHGENTEKRRTLPQEYVDLFISTEVPQEKFWISEHSNTLEKLKKIIHNWSSGKSEDDNFVLCGEAGIGKLSLLLKLQNSIHNEVDVKILDTPAKMTTKSDFYAELSRILGHEIKSAEDVVKLDSKLNRSTIILMDNMENIFLAQIGGFEAYKAFLDIINIRTHQLFWGISVSKRAWDYLKGVFGSSQGFSHEIHLEPWDDDEIKKLILTRHNLTGYSKEFDPVILALQESSLQEESQDIESQFFRLLWGQSRGNPKTALALWLSCLEFQGEKKLLVSAPSFSNSRMLDNMTDDTLFVYSSIIKHENLSIREIAKVTHLNDGVIKHALKSGQDKFLIFKDKNNRFRVTLEAQYTLNSFLLRKNFLYE